MTIRQVTCASWQLECCPDPFAVGDSVSWVLLLNGDPHGRTTVEGAVTAFGEAAARGGGAGAGGGGADADDDAEDSGGPRVIRSGGLHALVAIDLYSPPAPRARLTGELSRETHSGSTPLTSGTVRRIQVICEPVVPGGPGETDLVADPDREPYLRDVDRCPATFAVPPSEVLGALEPERPGATIVAMAVRHAPGVRESGVLVDLDIPS